MNYLLDNALGYTASSSDNDNDGDAMASKGWAREMATHHANCEHITVVGSGRDDRWNIFTHTARLFGVVVVQTRLQVCCQVSMGRRM